MIYLYRKEIKSKIYSAKLVIEKKFLAVELINNKTEKLMIAKRDLSNERYNTFLVMTDGEKVQIVEAFRYTHAFREELWHIQSMFNMRIMLVIKLGNIVPSSDNFDMIIEAVDIPRNQLEITTTFPIKEEVLKTGKNHIFEKNKRRIVFPSYSLSFNEIEYMCNGEGSFVKENNNSVVLYDKDYIDIKIKKYNYLFEEEKTSNIDNEKIYIESTCGSLSASMIQLKNGEGTIRLYPLGYEGIFTIKIGWRWYRVRNQYDLILKRKNTEDGEINGDSV